MDYIVYIADECRKEARTHNYTDALEKQSRDVEQKQNIDNFEKFPTPFFVKKQFAEYKGRLIAAQEIVNIDNSDYAVIKFLAVLIKADKEYNDFEDSRTKVNGDRYLNRVNSEELREFVKEKIAKEPPSKKQSLSNEEESFLYSSNTTYNLENESLIYESESWIKTINSKQYVNYLSAIYDAVFEIVNGDNSDKHCIGIKNLPNHNIVFFYDREKKYVFLDGIYATGTEIEKSIYRWTKRKETSDIVRIARRSYPQYLIAEADLWLEIEKDPQSNFALSGEEIDVLKSINNQNPFPIFINGRAGSGKSTILQYLFAEYFSRYLSYQDAVPPPAYFTYNSELLKQAKKFVFSLLKTNSNFLENIQGKINDNDLNQKLDVSFNELRKYLLSIVDDENLFLQDKYINYSTFMKLWNNKFKADKTAQKEYPADISWHVIRTYIEGMKPKGYLEPEEYNGLEKDQKTVSFELYQKIYKTVWEWYRKLKEEQGHWDDQDLVRYIIEHDIVTSRFSGVFCDEAQDFTRIEMEVIYHLSIFSDRDIPIQYVPMIPFAFAGDELQTINPTGFRWDAITALFTEKFILSVYPDKSRIPPMNFSELKNNYRSTQNIVNFCNALQLFRADRFNIPNLLPQYTWENSGGPSVARFEPKNAIFWKGIKEKSDSVVFIIPCNEGDEIEWIRNDSELSANITIRDNKTPDILVLSANSAKGLEFAQVVVWKFGNQPGLEKLINRPATEDAAQLLPLQYHINKTYVAVSRTKNKLYLLDDDTGINYLWRVTQDSDLINSYLSRINKNPKKWSDGNLETYKEGSPLDFSDNIIDNHEETAKQLMENGLVSKQSYLLRQAARIFTNLKDTQRSSKCKGYAEIFDNSYFSSGNHFHDGGWIDLAIQAFLLANTIPTDKNGFNKIIELSELHATVTNTLPYYVALAVCDTTIESVNNLMDFLLNNNTSLPFDKYFPHEAMKEIISSALDKCLGQITNNKQGLDSLLGRVLKLYQQKTISIQPEIIAELAFSLSKYKIAIDYWNMSQKRDEKKYEDAQKQLKGFPDNITVLFSGGDYQNIVAEYRKYDGKISENDLMMVIQALFLTNLHDEAFNEVVNIHSAGQFEKIIHACSSSLSSKEKTILSVCQRIAVIFDEPWNRILKLIDSTKNENINPFYIAIALARTKGLPNQPSTIQKPITDFMEKEFTKKFDTIPDSLILVIGTAIEKAGRRVAALKYYEFAMKRFAGDTEKEQICAERWIHTKELQANAELNKEKKTISLDEAEKMRKKYGININEKIDDFIALDGKSTVIKYIIDTEMKKTPDEIKPSNVTIKIHHENDKNQIAKTDNGIKQKTEFDIEDYRLVYFTKARRINITSNANGKTISLYHFNKSNDCFSSQDYVVTDSFIDDIGGCKKIEETPIHFSITEEKITVFFEKSKVAVNFL